MNDQEIHVSLSKLPVEELDTWRTERIRAEAHERLEGPRNIWAWYDRLVEPALVATGSMVLLGWAIQAVSLVHGG